MDDTKVGVIIFKKKKDKHLFLILKRVPDKGGFWQYVSGGVEKYDKTILDAAYREVKEEAGISREDIVKVYENVFYFEINKHYLTGETTDIKKEYVLGFEVKADVNVDISKNHCNEHDDFRWVLFNDALDLLYWQENKEGFMKLKERLFD